MVARIKLCWWVNAYLALELGVADIGGRAEAARSGRCLLRGSRCALRERGDGAFIHVQHHFFQLRRVQVAVLVCVVQVKQSRHPRLARMQAGLRLDHQPLDVLRLVGQALLLVVVGAGAG